ncbi:MAG: DNA alkylation repair protein [Bacteroidetes bacterium]|nr:DNA alkylation repair protein [Bacteroidota bacterium]
MNTHLEINCSQSITAHDLQKLLSEMANPSRAAHSQRFFKTGKGEYGEGDLFRGIPVPKLRKVARKWNQNSLPERIQ